MTTHVFVVDMKTFRIHLEYLFAGTGARDNHIDFNNSVSTCLYPTTENMLVSMIADASRIRTGDQILFYLQQNISGGIPEGKFYGIFKAKNNGSFLDNYAPGREQYLIDDLGKSLTFRTLIEPMAVYSEGVTEWQALDEIKNIVSPHQMLWSLIYRKLKGNRGNTMITLYESERLCQLIRNKNQRRTLDINQQQRLSFDSENQQITVLNQPPLSYEGASTEINILPRLIEKYKRNQSFETHLQAYIVGNIGFNTNPTLDGCLLENSSNIEWLGNEVSCGVGMQRMDIMLSLLTNGQRQVVPIELKAVEAQVDNIRQIKRYIDWIEQYYIPNRHSDIQPVLIAREMNNNMRRNNFLNTIKDFNQEYNNRCCDLKYIEYKIDNNENLIFERIV